MESRNTSTTGTRDRTSSFGTSLGQSGNLLAVMSGGTSSSRDISQAVESFIYKLKRRYENV